MWLGWLRIVSLNFLITLANETFILDDGNCIVTVKYTFYYCNPKIYNHASISIIL